VTLSQCVYGPLSADNLNGGNIWVLSKMCGSHSSFLSCRSLVYGQFMRSLKTTFPTAVARQQTAENNSKDLHAQNTTAL